MKNELYNIQTQEMYLIKKDLCCVKNGVHHKKQQEQFYIQSIDYAVHLDKSKILDFKHSPLKIYRKAERKKKKKEQKKKRETREK